jgi:hypothetical protein
MGKAIVGTAISTTNSPAANTQVITFPKTTATVCKTVGSVTAELARADAGRTLLGDVTYSSRTRESDAAAVDRFVDRRAG